MWDIEYFVRCVCDTSVKFEPIITQEIGDSLLSEVSKLLNTWREKKELLGLTKRQITCQLIKSIRWPLTVSPIERIIRNSTAKLCPHSGTAKNRKSEKFMNSLYVIIVAGQHWVLEAYEVEVYNKHAMSRIFFKNIDNLRTWRYYGHGNNKIYTPFCVFQPHM